VEYLINDIARFLRKAGIPVSVSEVDDCINALKQMKEVDENNLTFVLSACMVKKEWGAELISKLLDLYFEIGQSQVSNAVNEIIAPVSSSMGTGMGRIGKGVPVDVMIDIVFKKDIEQLNELLNLSYLESKLATLEKDEAITTMKTESGWFEVSNFIETSCKQGKLLPDEYRNALESLKAWQQLLEKEFERMKVNQDGEEYLINILERLNPRRINFSEADNNDMRIMAKEVEKLGRKLAVIKGRRKKASIKGQVDLRKTVLRSLSTGGVPFKLYKKDNKPSKPDLWLLCDLSNSVRKFSFFMLLLVYSIQKRYSNIKSFIFVDKLLEVTYYLKELDWNQAMDNIRNLKGYNDTGFSHYGSVFHQFNINYLNQLNKNVTVIILGDAKNNWNKTDGREVLSSIKAKAAALYWLNPMDRELWYKDDCVMSVYAENCTEVFQCSNIEQLDEVIKKIL